MARYIDADELCRQINDLNPFENADMDVKISEIMGIIADMLPADVQEVRHGKFISELVKKSDWAGRLQSYYQPNSCNQCHNALSGKENYCPFCGAKMDEDKIEEDD